MMPSTAFLIELLNCAVEADSIKSMFVSAKVDAQCVDPGQRPDILGSI